MAYVTIPKDLTKVKNKVAFNLTLRQIICIVVGAALGIPFYFLTRNYIGTSGAATGMVLLMLPAFLFAMYEKDGMPLEQILQNIFRVYFQKPAVRRYETENLYETAVAETALRASTEKERRFFWRKKRNAGTSGGQKQKGSPGKKKDGSGNAG